MQQAAVATAAAGGPTGWLCSRQQYKLPQLSTSSSSGNNRLHRSQPHTTTTLQQHQQQEQQQLLSRCLQMLYLPRLLLQQQWAPAYLMLLQRCRRFCLITQSTSGTSLAALRSQGCLLLLGTGQSSTGPRHTSSSHPTSSSSRFVRASQCRNHNSKDSSSSLLQVLLSHHTSQQLLQQQVVVTQLLGAAAAAAGGGGREGSQAGMYNHCRQQQQQQDHLLLTALLLLLLLLPLLVTLRSKVLLQPRCKHTQGSSRSSSRSSYSS